MPKSGFCRAPRANRQTSRTCRALASHVYSSSTRRRARRPIVCTSSGLLARLLERTPQAHDELWSGRHWQGDAGGGTHVLSGTTVVDDDGDEPQRHRLEHHRATELAHARKAQHVGLGEPLLKSGMRDEAGESDAARARVRRHGSKPLELRAVSDDVDDHAPLADERGGGFQQHVGALVGHQAPDEGDAERPRRRALNRAVEPVRLDAVLGHVDGLRARPGRDLVEGRSGAGEDRRGVAARRSMARQQPHQAASVREPVALPADLARELGLARPSRR